MKHVILNQSISLTSKVFISIVSFFIVTILSMLNGNFGFMYLIILAFIFLKKDYIIYENFSNIVRYRVFSVLLYKNEINLTFPEYISLFEQKYKQTASFGFMILGEDKFRLYTIKFFKGRSNNTVFKSRYKEEVLDKGHQLSTLLGVRINNTLK